MMALRFPNLLSGSRIKEIEVPCRPTIRTRGRRISGRPATGNHIAVLVILMLLVGGFIFIHFTPGFIGVEHEDHDVVKPTLLEAFDLARHEKVGNSGAIDTGTRIRTPYDRLKKDGGGNREMFPLLVYLLLQVGLDIGAILGVNLAR